MTQVMSLFIFPKPPQQPQDPLSQGSSSKQAHSTFLPLPSAIKQLEWCNLPPASSRELPGTGQGSRSCCTSTAAAWALPGCDTQKAQCSKCSGYSWARSCCPAHPARSTASAACLELTACLAGHCAASLLPTPQKHILQCTPTAVTLFKNLSRGIYAVSQTDFLKSR